MSKPEVETQAGKVLKLLPVQDAPRTDHRELVVKRKPGRPRKVDRAPTTSDLEYHAKMAEIREDFLESDAVVQAIAVDADSHELFKCIKLEVAKEAASLHFERIETEKRGRDTSMISGRRIEALKKVAEIEMKVKEAEAGSINPKSEKMQKIFALWVEILQKIAKEVLPEEHYAMLFNRFGTAMEGWEEKVQNELR